MEGGRSPGLVLPFPCTAVGAVQLIDPAEIPAASLVPRG